MGGYYTLRLYKGADQATMRKTMVEAAEALGGSIRWGVPSTEGDLRLAERGTFEGLAIHRVVPDFVVQMGSPYDTMDGGPGNDQCLTATDQIGGNDTVIGGGGTDTYELDPGDEHRSAEILSFSCIDE